MPVLLGLDLGEKRIGVAVTDEMGSMAFPVTTIMFNSRKHVVAELNKVLKEHRVEKIIVGLPRTMKGELGPAAERVTGNVEFFKTQILLPWIFWDERLSTKEVERVLLAADVSRAKRKEVRDQLAAQRILQSYLDHHASGGGS